MSDFGIIAQTLSGNPESLHNPAIAIAATRAGGIGILSTQYAESDAEVHRQLCKIAKLGKGVHGIKCSTEQLQHFQESLVQLKENSGENPNLVILCPPNEGYTVELLKCAINHIHSFGLKALVETINIKEALMAEAASADAVIAKGHESAGRVGDETTFVLLQRYVRKLKLPIWAEGGIGLHTALACYTAGAAGIVLESQLLLCDESPLCPETKEALSLLDGTETITLGIGPESSYRLYTRPGKGPLDELQSEAKTLASRYLQSEGDRKEAQSALSHTIEIHINKNMNAPKASDRLWVLGQDIAFSGALAKQFNTVAGIIQAIRSHLGAQIKAAKELLPFCEGSPLATSHGTRYPIAQGAMTRVSDTADFALSVARGGALPFLALALMRKGEVERLLMETSEKLSNLPWGVGILGFVPQQLRQEQLEVIEKYKPAYALIAGGRPDQASSLEAIGIKTYLHVPSPLLLKSFAEMGSKRFIFEGKECGGHVGPRSSFVLWECMIKSMLDMLNLHGDASSYHVLFAGGIHDELSAAMVAAMATPLAQRGVRIGVLLGTAYLFTEEAVTSGAIVQKFQEAALNCNNTVLLETGPGHLIRCINSPYKTTFDKRRLELEQQGRTANEIREELELMNLGRLRIASKGITRVPTADEERNTALTTLTSQDQWSQGMYMIGQVAALHDKTLSIEELHHNVSTESTNLIARLKEKSNTIELPQPARENTDIAIIGMSCLFPGANNLEDYWENILNKVDAITEIPKTHWQWEQYYDPNPLARDKIVSKWGGFINSIPFLPSRYGIPPKSLASIDPMQLLILEITRAALNDAGYAERQFPRERTSVVLANAGHGPITALYSLRSMLDWKLWDADLEFRATLEQRLPEWTEDTFPGYLGNVTAGRVANRFDLGGINFSIDAACASSLAALYVAMRDLRSHSSDMVLLAATDTHNQPGDYLSFSKVHALSRQGRCRTFDATADGIVISEGVAMLVLKRLADAERDGDRIYSVIKGIGGSSDGRDLSLTAPRPYGQILALGRAYQDAAVSPATVGLIEAHGTGTIAGDKAEIEALKKVFEAAGAPRKGCAIGSVKTMIGHTKAAAGLASIIKVAKALHHKILPPTIGVEAPNPHCNFSQSPFHINSEVRPWIHSSSGDKPIAPRRAGVSAFGFGGTNFHAVLEEYTEALTFEDPAALKNWPSELFLLRSTSKQGILKQISTLKEIVKGVTHSTQHACSPVITENPLTLKDLAYNWHRTSLKTQWSKKNNNTLCLSIIASSLTDLIDKLEVASKIIENPGASEIKDPRGVYFNQNPLGQSAKIAALFPGQGSQQVNMLKDLSLVFPEIRKSFEKADKLLNGCFAQPLSDFVFPPPAFVEEEFEQQQKALTNTHVAQPAIAAANLALWHLMQEFNFAPDMVAGHSLGEYVALGAAGVLNEDDLLRLTEQRGKLLSSNHGSSSGTMAAVTASDKQVEELLHHLPDITLANVNAPNQCVLAGSEDAIANAIAVLREHNIKTRLIPVSAAFHSPLVAHVQGALAEVLGSFKLATPQLTVFSNTSAGIYPSNPQEARSLLAEHVARPVLFAQQIEAMHNAGAQIFLEVGPGSVLTGLVDSILSNKPHLALSLDRSGRHGISQLLHVLGQLASHGVNLDIGKLFYQRMQNSFIELNANSMKSSTHQGEKLTYLVNSTSVDKVVASEQQKDSKPSEQKRSTQPSNRPSTHDPVKQTTRFEQIQDVQKAAQNKAMNQDQKNNGNKVNRMASIAVDSPKESISPAATASALNHKQAPAPKAAIPTTADYINKQTPQTPASANMRPIDRTSTAQVMLEFQRTMLQMTNSFLETQQNVMLAYLRALGQNNTQGAESTELVKLLHSIPMAENAHLSASSLPATQTRHSLLHDALTTPELQQQHADLDFHSQQQSALSQTAQLSQTLQSTEFETKAHPTQSEEDSTTNNTIDGDQSVSMTSSVDLVNGLLEIVSERTGYPTEMLDPNLDLEADLGIDSIKRVEILNSFRKLLPAERQAQLEGGIEKLAGTKTLQGIIDWIQADLNSTQEAPANEVLNNSKQAEQQFHQASNISRGRIQLVELSPAQTAKSSVNGTILITADSVGIAHRVKELLESQGRRALLIHHDKEIPQKKVTADAASSVRLEYSANLLDNNSVVNLVSQIQENEGPITGLIHTLSFAQNNAATDTDSPTDNYLAPYSLFLLAKHLEPSLIAQDDRKQAALIAITSLGGDFSSSANSLEDFQPIQAATVGLTKSLAREWPKVRVKSADFSPKETVDKIANLLVTEFDANDDRVEIGYFQEERIGLDVVPAPLDSTHTLTNTDNRQLINSNSVILVTGGARGITADICLELAEQFRPTFIIVGRLPRPTSPEDPGTASLSVARDLKAAIMSQLKEEGKTVSVPIVESLYQKLLREREIRSNLDKLEALGSQVHYFPLDVTESDAFGKLIDNIYNQHGNIDGVIHGAGIIEDGFVRSKSLESFSRVFETKVSSALVLHKKLRLESLKFLFFFSSVVGRTGNAGQSDYVAANEVLNKLAVLANGKTPARVASIMWGPWRGGMAQPELESIFASFGWAMIESVDGRRVFHDELQLGLKDDVEVLLVGQLASGNDRIANSGNDEQSPNITPSGARLYKAEVSLHTPRKTEFKIVLDAKQDLYLNDHMFDGIPVMPMAVALELMAEAAVSVYDGWQLASVFNLDIPSGIVFDTPSRELTIVIEEEQRTEDSVQLLLQVAADSAYRRTHFKATAILKKHPDALQVHPIKLSNHYILPSFQQSEYSLPLRDFIYKHWLFHGPIFQGIKTIDAMGVDGIAGQLQVVPPSQCLAETNGDNWLINPVLLDSAMQLAGVWARHYMDITVLPTGFKALHKLGSIEGSTFKAIVTMPPELKPGELSCDLAIYGAADNLVLAIEGLGGIGNKALNRLADQSKAIKAIR